MLRRLTLAALLSASLAATTCRAQTASPQLAVILAQMDTASRNFQNASASVERDFYERIVRSTNVQKGTVYFERSAAGTEFGATVYDVAESGQQAATPSKILSYTAGTLRLYTPGVSQVDVFQSGANQARYEGYLTLGFGGSGHALAQAWDITDAGPETLSDSGQPVKTEKLVLISKDPSVRNTFKQVTLWVDPVRDISLKQLFETPSGNRQTALYSNIRLNSRLNKAPYTIPKKATVIQH